MLFRSNGTRCEDNVIFNGKELPHYLVEINYGYPDRPFTSDESKPAKVEKGSANKEYFESPATRKLLDDFKALRGYDDDDPINKESTSSENWQQKLLDYLRRLEAWDGDPEGGREDYFHQKCILYRGLLTISPRGNPFDQVLLSYIKLLSQESIVQESRIEWLWNSMDLFKLVRERQGAERSHILTLILNSNSRYLQLYASLIKADLI